MDNMDLIDCQCSTCRENPAPSPDEVIVGLTTALLQQDWNLVGRIAQIMQDRYGTMSEDDVMHHATTEATRAALAKVVVHTTPIEA